MIDRVQDDAEEYYDGVLPVEVVDELVNKWRSRIQHECCIEWTGDMYAFLDHAAKLGCQFGDKVLRADKSRPYGPDNCYFGKTIGAKPPEDMSAGGTETFAERWDRCVYEFNRKRVAAYRGAHAATEVPRQETQEPVIDCQWYQDEFCVNGDCPAVADYCPVAEYPELCRFRKPREDEAEQ